MTRIVRAAALLALALLTAMALAGPAAAKKKPKKHDKGAQASQTLPKKWAKKHKARAAKADPDRDGLTNWGEWRAHTKPKKADSDKDGVADADEDFDKDRLDNGSEEDSRTDPGVKDTDRDGKKDDAEDADKDRLANAAEDLTENDPRDPDTDGDGVRDGDENAGTIKASSPGSATIALAVGGTLTASLDADSAVFCEDETGYTGDEDFGDDDDLGDEDFGDDEGDFDDGLEDEGLDELDAEEDGSAFVVAALAEEGDEDDPGDEEWEEFEADDECGALVAPGTAVHEAVVENGVFVTLELVLKG